MPVYTYSCSAAHHTDVYVPLHGLKPASVACEKRPCRRRAKYDLQATYRCATITPDVQEHYNPTIDMYVKSRRHLRQLQREHGFSDYEKGIQKPSSSWQETGRASAEGRGMPEGFGSTPFDRRDPTGMSPDARNRDSG